MSLFIVRFCLSLRLSPFLIAKIFCYYLSFWIQLICILAVFVEIGIKIWIQPKCKLTVSIYLGYSRLVFCLYPARTRSQTESDAKRVYGSHTNEHTSDVTKGGLQQPEPLSTIQTVRSAIFTLLKHNTFFNE